MGVVNTTPDSFSDGGAFLDPDRAVRHGLELVAAGADVVDVGGESTRPGARPVPRAEELRRVVPVVRALAGHGVPVSVDTMHAEVAAAAVGAGAALVNDVSGGRADPDMAAAVASLGVPWVLGHWRAPSAVMHRYARYRDVVGEVRAELARRVEAALAAGVDESAIRLDPGLGFAKRPEHDWALVAGLGRLVDLGFPVVAGASRKSFLGAALGSGVPPSGRAQATVAVTALLAVSGVWCVRAHDVRENREALLVASAYAAARASAGPTTVG